MTQPPSYYHQGLEDAKAGRGPKRPFPNAYEENNEQEHVANQAYMAGYRFGCTRRYDLMENEGSEP